MNTPLARLEDRRDLGQVRPPVHALQQDDVDFGEQSVDAVDELDASLLNRLAENLSTRLALIGRSGLPPLYAATTLTFHSGCEFRVLVNCGTWDVSVPMMPARSSRVAHAGALPVGVRRLARSA